MAPSTKSVRSSAKDEIKQQEILQAIIIADNFSEKLHPVTISKPNVSSILIIILYIIIKVWLGVNLIFDKTVLFTPFPLLVFL